MPVRHWRGATLTVAALLGIYACALSAPVTPPSHPTDPVFRGVSSLEPGGLARLYGLRLGELDSIRVNGRAVPVQRVDERTVRFTVPTHRTCDVDGDRVEITTDDPAVRPLVARLRVEPSFELEVGESRLLTPADWACLRLAAGDERTHVLHTVNLGQDVAYDTLFELRSFAGDAPAESQTAQPQLASLTRVHSHRYLHSPGSRARGVEAPAEEVRSPPEAVTFSGMSAARRMPMATRGGVHSAYDPSLPTAAVGDRVQLVDWWETPCDAKEFSVYDSEVIALHGRVMYTVDRRVNGYAVYRDPEVRARFQRSAEIVDRVLLSTLRAVTHPDFTILPGAGGRVVISISNVRSGAAGTISAVQLVSRDRCPPSTETMKAYLHAGMSHGWSVSQITRITIHELAHAAERAVATFHHRNEHFLRGWAAEALAVNAEETAARILSEQPEFARREALGAKHPYIRWPRGPHRHSGSLYGRLEGERWAMAQYDLGSQIWLYLRELLGEARPEAVGGVPLHTRVNEREARSLEEIAGAVGHTARDVLDGFVLARLTHGFVPDQALERHGIHRFRSWHEWHDVEAEMARERSDDGDSLLERGRTDRRSIATGTGTYRWWWIPPGDAGMSLSVAPRADPDRWLLRLTRLK